MTVRAAFVGGGHWLFAFGAKPLELFDPCAAFSASITSVACTHAAHSIQQIWRDYSRAEDGTDSLSNQSHL